MDPVHSHTLIKTLFLPCSALIFSLFIFAFTFIFHTIRLILCIQQAREIDNLPVSLGQSSLIVLCAGSTLGVGATNNLLKCYCSYWIWQPWFLTEGILDTTLLHTFLLGSPNKRVPSCHQVYFLELLTEIQEASDRRVLHFQSHYFFCLAYFILSCLL